jgi:hypothetical protein
VGRNTAELEAFSAAKLEGTLGGDVLGLVLELVPDFRMFYVSGANYDGTQISVHESFVSWGYVASAGAYAAAYGGTCLLVAVLLFRRRDFI